MTSRKKANTKTRHNMQLARMPLRISQVSRARRPDWFFSIPEIDSTILLLLDIKTVMLMQRVAKQMRAIIKTDWILALDTVKPKTDLFALCDIPLISNIMSFLNHTDNSKVAGMSRRLNYCVMSHEKKKPCLLQHPCEIIKRTIPDVIELEIKINKPEMKYVHKRKSKIQYDKTMLKWLKCSECLYLYDGIKCPNCGLSNKEILVMEKREKLFRERKENAIGYVRI